MKNIYFKNNPKKPFEAILKFIEFKNDESKTIVAEGIDEKKDSFFIVYIE